MHIVNFDNTRTFRQPVQEYAVDRGEWRRGSENIYTSRVSTGVILAALNPGLGQGVIGHFCNLTDPSPRFSDSDVFDRCLTEIQILGMYDTQVWAGGASNTISQAGRKWTNVEADRLYAEEQMAAHNLDFNVNWAPENMVTYANLQPAAGRLAISQFALSYLQ